MTYFSGHNSEEDDAVKEDDSDVQLEEEEEEDTERGDDECEERCPAAQPVWNLDHPVDSYSLPKAESGWEG